jgi:hypothetical protein
MEEGAHPAKLFEKYYIRDPFSSLITIDETDENQAAVS